MVGVDMKEGENIDKLIKRFKKKYEKAGVLKEFRVRTFFVKPSIEEKMKRSRSKRKIQILGKEMNS